MLQSSLHFHCKLSYTKEISSQNFTLEIHFEVLRAQKYNQLKIHSFGGILKGLAPVSFLQKLYRMELSIETVHRVQVPFLRVSRFNVEFWTVLIPKQEFYTPYYELLVTVDKTIFTLEIIHNHYLRQSSINYLVVRAFIICTYILNKYTMPGQIRRRVVDLPQVSPWESEAFQFYSSYSRL